MESHAASRPRSTPSHRGLLPSSPSHPALGCKDVEAKGCIWATRWRVTWAPLVPSMTDNSLLASQQANLFPGISPWSPRPCLGFLELPQFSKLASTEERALRALFS